MPCLVVHVLFLRRYHSLAGAAKCADELGDHVKASAYYGQVGLRLTLHPSLFSFLFSLLEQLLTI